ncbi:hypothetical protein MAR_034673 [Mya arenaria]|uniref:DNA-directed DNA polymerase n=1 Tax=Mya arenaria TaxID=6604 RepID=A0ABY7EKU2_MYAAR|nr:hypothetical protein MAR_034673 [Mya arenaria]
MTAFLNRNYFCDQCKKGYQHKERHSCNNPYNLCRRCIQTAEEWNIVIHDCFMQHMKKTEDGISTCDTFFRCKQCSQLINLSKHKRPRVRRNLMQNMVISVSCNLSKMLMKSSKSTIEKTLETKYIFLVLNAPKINALNVKMVINQEPRLSVRIAGNLVHNVCGECIAINITPSSKCFKCGTNERFFAGPNTTYLFCKWLFSEENESHGYNSYPILRYLHTNAVLPEIQSELVLLMDIELKQKQSLMAYKWLSYLDLTKWMYTTELHKEKRLFLEFHGVFGMVAQGVIQGHRPNRSFQTVRKGHQRYENQYYDVTSLYPFINKTANIPMGHPKIITENLKEIGQYEGLVKCKVLPPKGPNMPVLPMKCTEN